MGGGLGSAVLKEGNPLGLHFIMFIPALMGQGTPEQQSEWLTKAYNFNIVGTYAQVLHNISFCDLKILITKRTIDL